MRMCITVCQKRSSKGSNFKADDRALPLSRRYYYEYSLGRGEAAEEAAAAGLPLREPQAPQLVGLQILLL